MNVTFNGIQTFSKQYQCIEDRKDYVGMIKNWNEARSI